MIMLRSERLPKIIRQLEPGRVVIGRDIAAALSVSDRTIKRDIAILKSVGLNIFGEPGLGYYMPRRRS